MEVSATCHSSRAMHSRTSSLIPLPHGLYNTCLDGNSRLQRHRAPNRVYRRLESASLVVTRLENRDVAKFTAQDSMAYAKR